MWSLHLRDAVYITGGQRGSGGATFILAAPPALTTLQRLCPSGVYFLVSPFQYSEVMGLKVALVSPSPVTRLLWNW